MAWRFKRDEEAAAQIIKDWKHIRKYFGEVEAVNSSVTALPSFWTIPLANEGEVIIEDLTDYQERVRTWRIY